MTVLGDVEGGGVRRDGARPGDRLVVVGSLGAAATALAQVAAGSTPTPRCWRPTAGLPPSSPRARCWPLSGATALIDVSDGLGADVGHVCAASGVRARLDAAALPAAPGVATAAAALGADAVRLVCGGGEDFALVAALPAERAVAAAAAAGAADGVPAAVVGEFLPAGDGPAVVLATATGDVDLTGYGWDHYRQGADAGAATPPAPEVRP